MNRFATAAAALALTAIAGTAAAAEYSVCAAGCDFDSIQDAVDASSAWDVLNIEAETFAESVYIDKDLVIDADFGAVLEGDGTGPALTVDFGVDVDIDGLKITGGGGAAGVLNYGTLVLAGCWIYGHDALYGAVLNAGDLYVVGDSAVMANVGEYFAGGITNFGDLQVSNATITGNQGYMGAGIANVDGTTSVINSSFSFNEAETLGGAWSNHNTSGDFHYAASNSMSNNTASSYADCYDVDGHAACTP